MKQTQRWSVLLCLACLGIALIVQFAGFVSNGWIYLKGDVYTVHAGLWYRVTCKNGEDCSTTPMINSNQNNDMLEYQIEASIALAACVMAVASVTVHARHNCGHVILFLVLGMLASILSGVIALVASGKMGHSYLRQHEEQMANYGKSVYKTPYSAVLTGVGGLIACLITFGLVVEAHVSLKQNQRRFTLAESQAMKYKSSVDAVTRMATGTERHFSTRTNHDSTRRLPNIIPPDETGCLYSSGQKTGKGNGKDVYNGPTLAATICSDTVDNVTNHVNPIIGEKKPPDDQNLESVDLESFGNVVLQNGQHVVMNDVYNL